jgi:hypothetical protein
MNRARRLALLAVAGALATLAPRVAALPHFVPERAVPAGEVAQGRDRIGPEDRGTAQDKDSKDKDPGHPGETKGEPATWRALLPVLYFACFFPFVLSGLLIQGRRLVQRALGGLCIVGFWAAAVFGWGHTHLWFGSLLITLFAIVLTLSAAQTWSLAYQRARVARAMARACALAAPPDDARDPTSDAVRVAPELKLALFEEEKLPALQIAADAAVSAAANIVGVAPPRILYLYNFFSAETAVAKRAGDWRRFGPTYLLSSPGDPAAAHTWSLNIARDVLANLVPDAASFETRFGGIDDTPLAPGDRRLRKALRVCGAYPQHTFLCADASWKHAVRRLIDHVDVVLVDASGYSAARAGLGWEIGQLVDHAPIERLVVLVDEDADQAALAGAFDAAWRGMAGASPNNRADGPAALRLVRLSHAGLGELVLAMLMDTETSPPPVTPG